ncbi:MAG TPA: hypothetical protein VN650_10140 [Gemmatimonadaceae bacterium]|nr:hypothetical protein [Gemmatimonadaceae bacterium]
MRTRLALAGTFVFVIAACTPKEKASVAKTDSTTAATVATAAATTAAAPNVVTVQARDFSYDGPSEIPAGMTTFKLVNDGKDLHHLSIIRLDSGKTLKDLEAALALPAAPPTWAVPMGGPNAPDPTKESNATLDLTPGNYAMVCFVDVPGGVPHFAKGMIKAFTVGAAPAGAAATAPVADVDIKLVDYGFDLSKPLTAGTHTFAVTNGASQPHEVELVRLAPGKTVEQLLGWMQKPAGPPPASAIGGVAGFIGDTNYFTADITPGQYALICFLPDAKDGKPHFMHGMTKTITVM